MERDGLILTAYASGDGSLSYVWLTRDQKASGRKVTLQDVIDYLASNEGKHLREKGWRVVVLNTLPCLVAPVKRINENTLEVEGQQYTYTVADSHFWRTQRHTNQTNLKMWFDDPGFGKQEVKNVNIKSATIHFLRHEKELTQ